MSTLKIKPTTEQAELLKGFSQAINNEWHHIPFWFKDLGEGVFEVHSLGDLPHKVLTVVKELREQSADKNHITYPVEA